MTIILMVFALVFLALEAFKITPPRIVFGWLGMALWALAMVIGAASTLSIFQHH